MGLNTSPVLRKTLFNKRISFWGLVNIAKGTLGKVNIKLIEPYLFPSCLSNELLFLDGKQINRVVDAVTGIYTKN